MELAGWEGENSKSCLTFFASRINNSLQARWQVFKRLPFPWGMYKSVETAGKAIAGRCPGLYVILLWGVQLLLSLARRGESQRAT